VWWIEQTPPQEERKKNEHAPFTEGGITAPFASSTTEEGRSTMAKMESVATRVAPMSAI
jgi:hypothetical protein